METVTAAQVHEYFKDEKLKCFGPIKMTDDEYFAVNAINHSNLKYMKESASKYHFNLLHPRKPSPAMSLGKAIHCAVLEPDVFDATYAIQESFDKRTKAGKEKAAQWAKENEGKTAITQDDFDIIGRVTDTINNDPFFGNLINTPLKEVCFFLRYPKTGHILKCKVDAFHDEKLILVDLKTTDNAQPFSFNADITKYSYLTQAAIYSHIVSVCIHKEIIGFVILAVEKGRDNDMVPYYFDKPDLQAGLGMCEMWLHELKKCEDTNIWPGYERKFRKYNMPEWYINE